MSDHRTEPRRRGDQLLAAIYDAVLAELTQHGYAAVTMETVAQRARTGKASLYRRWPTRVEMIMDTIYSRLPADDSMIDTGTLRSDLIMLFERFAGELNGPVGVALRGLWAESLDDPEQHARVRGYSRHGGLRLLRSIVERAAARGEIDPAVITDQRLEAGPAILRYRLLLDGRPLDVAGLVDEVVLPLLAGPTVPTGRPVSGSPARP
ncbi:TetR/AcrR family transcriptional regulator [Microlunatus parietis]|uniref:AcrR family transcriptional regulator n=1 Tax=Microlunatus parietis TaxID=682979 RepID=A0A7Y9LCA0_9ACTN|nr:TetR/AcrR family transcriptional regulator [Microlunatus parietis]NYE71638.1 AcrR family transcriptional regulator [Microlunatus parietis]